MLFVYHWNLELKPMLLEFYFLVKHMYTQAHLSTHTYVNMHALAIMSKEQITHY